MKYQVRITRITTVLIDTDTVEDAIASALAGKGVATTTIQTQALPKPESSRGGDVKAAPVVNQ